MLNQNKVQRIKNLIMPDQRNLMHNLTIEMTSPQSSENPKSFAWSSPATNKAI